MQSWEKYIKSNVLKFRELYSGLPEGIRVDLKKTAFYRIRLNKPWQIVVVTFAKYTDSFFFISNSQENPDMEIIVYENIELADFWRNEQRQEKLNELFGEEGINFIKSYFMPHLGAPNHYWTFWDSKTVILNFSFDPRTIKNGIALLLFGIVKQVVDGIRREKQRKKIKSTVTDLKRFAEGIPETVQLKKKIIESTKRLEGQIKNLNKKFEEEVSVLRDLVGAEEHLGWRAFSFDIKRLKETHLEKEVFDTHVRRLDEKIENKTEALNTRIEDLKAIKFWSKRTLLEIALTVWGSIMTLYVSGILKV